VYYTPIFSNVALGEIFLRDVRDIRTGERVPHRLNGTKLSSSRRRSGPTQIWRRGSVSLIQHWIRKYLGRL
jgi:hypothetical protein